MDKEEVKKVIDSFGPRIRKYLLKEKMTDRAFAEKLDRSRGIGLYESKPGMLPNTSMILSIMEHFPSWSIAYILRGEGDMYTSDEKSIQHQPIPIGYYQNLVYWLALQADVKADIKVLPIDGFHLRAAHLKEELKEIRQENEALLRKLKNTRR